MLDLPEHVERLTEGWPRRLLDKKFEVLRDRAWRMTLGLDEMV